MTVFQDNLAKVALSPPIRVALDGHRGVLTALSPEHMQLEDISQDFPVKGNLIIELNTSDFKSIEVRRTDDVKGRIFYTPTTTAAKFALEDMLNIIRKNQHIEICHSQNVESSDSKNDFDRYDLLPCSLPNLNWEDLQISQDFLQRTFSAPLLITGMTGGVDKGTEINKRLAAAAAHYNIPMGVGSQRIALENPQHACIFQLKKYHPTLFLIGNLGMSQLKKGKEVEDCLRAIDMIEADAMAIHINVLQELVQEEGERNFSNLLDRIATIVNKLPVPLIIKEVGAGIDIKTAKSLYEIGVRHIDVGGKGGTSWAYIEGLRSNDPITQRLGNTFRNWGLSTTQCLEQINTQQFPFDIIATGGIRNGITVAKAIALGAKFAGIGLPLFRAALESEEAPFLEIETFIRELKTVLLCTNSNSIKDLKTVIKLKS